MKSGLAIIEKRGEDTSSNRHAFLRLPKEPQSEEMRQHNFNWTNSFLVNGYLQNSQYLKVIKIEICFLYILFWCICYFFFFLGCKYSEFRLAYGITLVYRIPNVFSKVWLFCTLLAKLFSKVELYWILLKFQRQRLFHK